MSEEQTVHVNIGELTTNIVTGYMNMLAYIPMLTANAVQGPQALPEDLLSGLRFSTQRLWMDTNILHQFARAQSWYGGQFEITPSTYSPEELGIDLEQGINICHMFNHLMHSFFNFHAPQQGNYERFVTEEDPAFLPRVAEFLNPLFSYLSDKLKITLQYDENYGRLQHYYLDGGAAASQSEQPQPESEVKHVSLDPNDTDPAETVECIIEEHRVDVPQEIEDHGVRDRGGENG